MTLSVHVHAAPADAFFVNSFVLEGPDALVVVDTQFLVSSATALCQRVASLGKPLAGIVITHPHPDHFNGLPLLLERFGSVPVYASAGTIAGIRATQADKRIAWTPVYGADYPATGALPDSVLGQDERLKLGGVVLEYVALGAGECMENSVIHLPETATLIVSDLVYDRCHPWLAEHRTSAWLDQLDEVARRFPKVTTVMAGHGGSGSLELLDEQRRYIVAFRKAVAAHARNGVVDEPGRAAVHSATCRGREGWPLADLVDMNTAAVAAELESAKP